MDGIKKLLKSKPPAPSELVKRILRSLKVLEEVQHKNDDRKDQEAKTISKDLNRVMDILYGAEGHEPSGEDVSKLATEIYQNNLLLELIKNLRLLEFESRKVASRIFKNLLIRQIGTRYPTVNHIAENPEIVLLLLDGYKNETNDVSIASCSGEMLRECMAINENLVKILLYDEGGSFYNLFDYVNLDAFDIASDAFRTFRDVLLKHKSLVAKFLIENYDKFFEKYGELLDTQNYVTLRQSLKLIAELLLVRDNFLVLQKYISDEKNLKVMMKLLAHPESNAIKFEAFHVFKCFVASPSKSHGVSKMLYKNSSKLIEYLENFQMERNEDEAFQDEKRYLIKQIRELKNPELMAEE